MRKLHTDPLIPGSYYHIYNRGVNGCDLFYELRNYVYFLKKYATYITPVADTFAYCLLRNHFHLLVRIKAPEELVRNKPDQILHPVADIATLQFSHLLNGYAQAINKAVGRSGALFESPFRRILVDNSAYLHQLVYYIHTNPERHGFISDYREYPHSSYKTFLSAKQSLLMRATALEWFGGMDGFAECHAAGALSGMPGFEREMVIEFE